MRDLLRFVFMYEMSGIGHRDDRQVCDEIMQPIQILGYEGLIVEPPDNKGGERDLWIPQPALAHGASTSENSSIVIDHSGQRPRLAGLLPVQLYDFVRHMFPTNHHALKDPSDDVAVAGRQGRFRKPGNLEDAHVPRSV